MYLPTIGIWMYTLIFFKALFLKEFFIQRNSLNKHCSNEITFHVLCTEKNLFIMRVVDGGSV